MTGCLQRTGGFRIAQMERREESSRMPNFISEDSLEKALVQKLTTEFGWLALNCYTALREDQIDRSNRIDKSEVLLLDRLRDAALRLNPSLPASAIDSALEKLADHRTALSLTSANQKIDGLIREGIPVEYSNAQGRKEHGRVRVIDFS